MKAILGGRRAGLALLWALCAIASALEPRMAIAGPSCQETIRVLLQRGGDSLTLESGGRKYRFEAHSEGVRVDGGPPVASWRSERGVMSRVGALRVRGAVEVLRTDRELAAVNEVPLEEYVAGVLGGEIPAGWGAAALRAQAVASRSYALHQRAAYASRIYHVEATTQNQVYAGAEVPETLRGAVRDTRCQILTWQGAPILAAFHATSGGRTASAREVWGRELRYLVSQEVADEDDSPDTYWRASVSRTTLGRALSAAGYEIGDPRSMKIEERSASGRVSRLRIRGARGETILSGRELRLLLGESTLRSTLFELRPESGGFRFVGSGRGHGVGMSQWGARSLAEHGASYREILETFYPGAELRDASRARRARKMDDHRPRRQGLVGAEEDRMTPKTNTNTNTREEQSLAIRSGDAR